MSLNMLVDSYVSLQPSLLQSEYAFLSMLYFPNPLSSLLLSCELFPINL